MGPTVGVGAECTVHVRSTVRVEFGCKVRVGFQFRLKEF